MTSEKLGAVVADAAVSWAALPAGAARSLELAHRSLIAEGLAVGAAITDDTGTVIAEGRNRAYDQATGTDPLEHTPLAHAEMNAMAQLDTDAPTDHLTLWSTQQPCSMCRAAIDFIGIPTTIAIATDPSSPHAPANEVLDDSWIVLATAMFLTGPFRRGGRRHSIVRDNETLEPEAIALAERLTSGSHPLTNGTELEAAVNEIWHELSIAADLRRHRRANGR